MNWMAFLLGFCAGAVLVLGLFYWDWYHGERRRALEELAEILRAPDVGVSS